VHVRTVQLKSKSYLVKNRVEHYLHLRQHGKGNRSYACLELVDGTDLTHCWWYAVPGDDGREKKEKRYTSARVYKAAIPLVLQSDGMSTLIVDVLHGFQLNYVMILYIRTVLSFARLCSRGSHFKLEIIDVTAPGSRS
jgi:hypothetical protein